MCRDFYIPKHCKSCRKRMKKHNLSLINVISSLYNKIPTDLNQIEEASSRRIVEICNIVTKKMFSDRVTHIDITLTGSTAERFNIPISSKWLKDEGGYKYMHALMSDFDFMLTPSDLEICNTTENSQYSLEFDDVNLKTGFVYVIDNEINSKVSGKQIMKDIKQIVLSLTPDSFVKPYDNPIKSNWLNNAKIFRRENDKEGLTWRISFSSAEVMLSKCIPEVARMCFIGMKVIAKDYLSITCKRIKSYHIKCIFLYVLERTDLNVWSSVEDLEVGFCILLQSVKTSIATRQCPHFWIPQINLFQEMTRKESERLLKVMERIEKSPEKYIENVEVKDLIIQETLVDEEVPFMSGNNTQLVEVLAN